jgi:HAD superfamily hydrolase (TIGR01549 family)
MFRWIFFDVGNVLLDEDPLTYLVFQRHFEAIRQVQPDVAFEEVLAGREACASGGSRWPVHDVAAKYLGPERLSEIWTAADREVRAEYGNLSFLIPGAAEAVAELSQGARLGLIANQPTECRVHLEKLGILAAFEVVLLSEEQGAWKPEPELFRRAQGQAGVAPSECLMVGDRLDNDLEPAAALGMATAWIRWPRRDAKGWGGDDARTAAYLRSLERSSGLLASRHRGARPDLVADRTVELPAALAARPFAPAPERRPYTASGP